MAGKERKKKEFRVFLDPLIAEKVEKLVERGVYGSPSEVLRDIVRDWYKEVSDSG